MMEKNDAVMRNAYRTLIMPAMTIWLLALATKQMMMQSTGGTLAMMMESVPVSLKTNWKAPGRKSQTETKGHEQITDAVR